MTIIIHVPGEAVGFARSGGNGTVRFTPKRQRDHMALIKLAAHTAMQGQPPLSGPVRMHLRVTYAIPKSWPKARAAAAIWRTSKPDADNLAKLVADAMNEIVFHDDAQIGELLIQKKYGPVPGLIATIDLLEGEGGRHD